MALMDPPPLGSAVDAPSEPQRGASLTPEALIGRVIADRYRIVQLLGQGGMGAVFTAEHLALRKRVALKVVRAELAGNGDVAARFAREALATAQFEHPHVASAMDYGSLPEGGAYLVMQLVNGLSLRRILASEQRLGWRRVCEIGAQVADALSAARNAGVIHRDLKPDNILIEMREDGSDLAKVLDFGIAYIASGESLAVSAPNLTREGTVVGTLGYMSPEQSVGDRVDHRSDLYALGVVMWEAVAGRRLWQSPDLAGVLGAQLTQDVPRLRDFDGAVPVEFDQLVQRLTARSAAARPEYAATVRDALRDLARRAPAKGPLLPAMLQRALRLALERAPVAWAALRRGYRFLRAQGPAVRAGLQRAQRIALAIGRWLRAMFVRFRAQPPRTQKLAGFWFALFSVGLLVFANLPEAAPHATEAGTGKAPPAASASRPVGWLTALSEPALPDELAPSARTLLESETGRERRSAADAIANYRPAQRVPGYLQRIAELERARTCGARKEALVRMQRAPDARYMATLQRFQKRRQGCGFLGLADCYDCVRNELSAAFEACQGAQ